MNIKKIITIGVAGVAMGAMALDNVEVTGVKARQRYPWNGKVDIDFTLDSKPTEPYQMQVEVYDNVGKTNLPVKSVCTEGVSMEVNPCMVRTDTMRIAWNAAKDLPNGFKCTNVLVSCRDEREIASPNRYMIVDISGGVAALSFPVSYTNSPPAGGWSEEYKLSKIVFRRIEPGVFTMGSSISETGHQSNETQHNVSISRAYYIAVFELTESQFSLICGGGGSDTQPVKKDIGVVRGFDVTPSANVTFVGNGSYNYDYDSRYNMTIVQKNAWQYAWPNNSNVDPSSIVGKMRSKTGLEFDLPTEAQWEYACRGGSLKGLNIGVEDNAENESLIRGDPKLDKTGTHYIYVGNYMPNAFGLYDMGGNVTEWCLDAYVDDLGSVSVVDPIGPVAELKSRLLTSDWVQVKAKGSNSTMSGPISVVFDGKTYKTTGWKMNSFDDLKYYDSGIYFKFTGYTSARVVRGGVRSASRYKAESMNTQGAIFTTGVLIGGKKVGACTYSNPVHGVRMSVIVP